MSLVANIWQCLLFLFLAIITGESLKLLLGIILSLASAGSRHYIVLRGRMGVSKRIVEWLGGRREG